jgi:hypothetical protein
MNETVKYLIGTVLVLFTIKTVKDLFTGEEDPAGKLPELFLLNREEYLDASQAARLVVQNRLPELSEVAAEIAASASFFNDDEERLYAAINRLRSKYEVLWMSNMFLGADMPSLGVFDTPPNAGEFMVQILSPRDWSRVVRILSPLPKY